MSATTRLCPTCGTPLPSDAPKGLCPECLLRGGFESAGTGGTTQPAGDPRQRTIHIVVPVDEPAGGVPETLRYFGDYELLEQIAAGGMGVVFKARQVSLNRTVAVKMIRAGHLAREDDIRRFRTEAEAAANLKHPHIVAIHEIGEHRGQHYFSMDFIEGCSLADLVRDRPLEPARAARLAQTIAEAIAYAHQRGVLHRDLKPSNVMMDAQGQPHVTDFGLAKIVERQDELRVESNAEAGSHPVSLSTQTSLNPQPAPHSQQTATGAIMGSPSYMSPEQAAGKTREITTATDVYSLGAMLYELLTTQPPFLAATALGTIQMVAEREPVAPRALNPAVPRDLETICLKCLEKSPARRYAGAQDLAEELGRFLRHEPIRARPAQVWERAVKWARRKPAWAALAGVSAAALVTITVMGVLGTARIREENRRTRLNEYAGDLYFVSHAVEGGALGPALDILERHVPSSGQPDLRGFEWRYFRQACEGEQIQVLRGHAAAVGAVDFSRDGRRLASGDEHGAVLLWEMEKGRQWRPAGDLGKNHGAVLAVRFSPDQQALAVSRERGPVQLWSVESRRLLREWPETGVQIAFLRLTNLLAVGSGEDLATRARGRTRLYDWTTGALALELPQAGGVLAVSDNGRRLATGTANGRIKVWRAGTTNLVAEFKDEEDEGLQRLALSDDGLFLVAGWAGFHRQPRLWDVTTGGGRTGYDGRLSPFEGHRARVTDLAFTPENRVATASADSTVRLWNARTGNVITQPAIVISPTTKSNPPPRQDGRASWSESKPGRPLASYRGHQSEVLALAVSPRGEFMASAGKDHTVRIWSAAERHLYHERDGVTPPLVFSPDSRWLAALNGERQVALWDASSVQFLNASHLLAGTNLVPAFFSADSATLALAGETGEDGPLSLQFWNMAQQRITTSLLLSNSAGMDAHGRATPDRRWFATADGRGRLGVWETKGGGLVAQLTNLPAGEVRMAWSPDGRRLALAGGTDQMEVWRFPEAVPQCAPAGHERAAVRDLAFTPDGALLVSGGDDNRLRLWNAITGEPAGVLAGHGEPVVALAIAPDGRTIASAGSDGTVRLWHVATRRELATLSPRREARALAFAPNGRALVDAARNGTLWFWVAPSLEDLARNARPNRSP